MRTCETNGITLKQVREYIWEMPKENEMQVPARVLASESLLDEINQDNNPPAAETHDPAAWNHRLRNLYTGRPPGLRLSCR